MQQIGNPMYWRQEAPGRKAMSIEEFARATGIQAATLRMAEAEIIRLLPSEEQKIIDFERGYTDAEVKQALQELRHPAPVKTAPQPQRAVERKQEPPQRPTQQRAHVRPVVSAQRQYEREQEQGRRMWEAKRRERGLPVPTYSTKMSYGPTEYKNCS